MNELCFIDCETTGVDPRRHAIWEIGLILPGRVDQPTFEWQLGLSTKELARADGGALRVGRYYERRNQIDPMLRSLREMVSPQDWKDGGYVPHSSRDMFASHLLGLIGSRHLAGMAVAFDARFVEVMAKHHGRVPAWHYHLIDVEALAAGHLHQPPPWRSKDLSLALGIDPDDFPRHTALGDALWAKAIYEAVMDDPAKQTT